MVTTDFCFPLPEYEYPRLVSYRHLFETYASPLVQRACTRDQETGEPGVSRRPIRFGGLLRLDARHLSSGRSRSSRTSDTPVASRRLPRAVARCVSPGRRGRFLRPSVKMRRSLRPEVPSTAGGHSRACVSRFRFRDAVTCVSATNPALAIPSPATPPAALSRRRRLLRARPPSLPTVRLAMFTRDADRRFSGSDGRPTTSATSLPTHGHTLEHPFLAKIQAPRLCGNPEPAFASIALFTAPWPSPVEEGPRRLRAVTTPPKPTLLRCKLAKERDPECHRPTVTPLAGDASIRPPFAAMAVERQRWIARAE